MSRKFFRGEALSSTASITVRLGVQNAPYKATELRKFVKQSGEGHVLCAVGDLIDGYITSVENATSDGYSIGSINRQDPKFVTLDGLQATPGVGAIAIGDFVVCGTVVAKDTDGASAHPKVCKATIQPGVTEAAAVGDVNDMLAMVPYLWKVVSLGPVGTGAVGTIGLIERVGGPAK